MEESNREACANEPDIHPSSAKQDATEDIPAIRASENEKDTAMREAEERVRKKYSGKG